MLEKTSGIVLHSIKYTDSTNIVTVYTRHFGRVSYMIHGINKKKSIFRSSYFQPLSILDMDVYHVAGKGIQRIKDIRLLYQFTGISSNSVKNAIALFISEILYRTLWQNEPDESIFLFLENSIQQLDCCESGISNFHLVFLLKLTRYLGFEPNNDEKNSPYFDLMNGIFLKSMPLHTHVILPADSVDFTALLNSDYERMQQLIFTRSKRLKLLESLIEYYRLHIPDFHGLHSLAVLQSLFD